MKIVIGADHGGFELKEFLKKFLSSFDYEVIDLGNHMYDPKDDYPDFAIPVARYISEKNADKGILICGSGIGASIAANKVKGVRAAICHDTYSARQGVEHDDMNVICLGGRIIGQALAVEIIKAFVNAVFTQEERHLRRVNKVNSLES